MISIINKINEKKQNLNRELEYIRIGVLELK